MSKTGFQRADDLVAVHGKRGNAEGLHRPPGWVSEEYTSIPAAIFMLAYGTGDGLVAGASKQHGILGGETGQVPLGLGSQGLVTAWAQAGHPLLARARSHRRTAQASIGGICWREGSRCLPRGRLSAEEPA